MFAALTALLVVATAWAAPPVKRARPPKFPKSITDIFFPDAREKLVGPRPAKAAGGEPETEATVGPTPAQAAPATAGESLWQPLITPETIEDEVKSQATKLGETVQNAVAFKAGAYQQARVNLSVLAAMFAIDADYGRPMRWQREASAARESAARAGFNCKVGTDASYQDARARFDNLQSLIRGEGFDAKSTGQDAAWNKIADRGPLMKRLEAAQDQQLKPLTADANAFSKGADTVRHEAQIIAALAAAIAQSGYEFADDDTYRGYADSMRVQAQRVGAAVDSNNYEQARQAVGEIGKACTSCHEDYRN